MKRVLVTGACGQIGSEAVAMLRSICGAENVIGLDLKPAPQDLGPHEILDVLDREGLAKIIRNYRIDTVLHLAAMLSATGEKKPQQAWRVNVDSLVNILELAREFSLRLFWPSSIAVFGANCPQNYTPQYPPLVPQTMYGVTKVAGELLCNYYFHKYGVDVRSVRYPGLISYQTAPGGGTTDYAVEIFYQAIEKREYTCFLESTTALPMMYMPDAIRAIEQLMQAESSRISVRTSYNLAAFSFAPKELAEEITKRIPDFRCHYQPDERQQIAQSWPKSIDDSQARCDWGWKPKYDLAAMTDEMLEKLREKLTKVK